MSSSTLAARLRPHGVPVAVFAVVLATVLVVPPAVLGEATARTYALATAVVVLSVSSAFPYAVAVAVATFPLVYLDAGSYASPRSLPGATDAPTWVAALRHAVAAVGYVLAAAMVGGVGIGLDFFVPSGGDGIPGGQPVFMLLGSGLVGVTFVVLQLWRYEAPLAALERRTVLGTLVLGALLVPAGRVALWVFGNGTPI